ncbi:hypothetical protein NDU88_005396 [Pleurodeles waltl]|uniref:Uncharacterized protein n=1 Tax=Pleurodeles waltl TaxID=8319 RepID=A0AAV7UIN6_PLEWA|nr:hypothetical protein NDU88_005396 [Pleurodeles waltl]
MPLEAHRWRGRGFGRQDGGRTLRVRWTPPSSAQEGRPLPYPKTSARWSPRVPHSLENLRGEETRRKEAWTRPRASQDRDWGRGAICGLPLRPPRRSGTGHWTSPGSAGRRSREGSASSTPPRRCEVGDPAGRRATALAAVGPTSPPGLKPALEPGPARRRRRAGVEAGSSEPD